MTMIQTAPAPIAQVRTGCPTRLVLAILFALDGNRHAAAAQLQLAWDRLTNSGDYLPCGHFDTIYPGWRNR